MSRIHAEGAAYPARANGLELEPWSLGGEEGDLSRGIAKSEFASQHTDWILQTNPLFGRPWNKLLQVYFASRAKLRCQGLTSRYDFAEPRLKIASEDASKHQQTLDLSSFLLNVEC